MSDDLPHLGPTDPHVRVYVTEVGTIVVKYARLEGLIIDTIQFAEALAAGGIVEVPDAFKKLRAQNVKRTLGRLLAELKALGVDAAIAEELHQVNQDRISVIHEAAPLTDAPGGPDLVAIRRERLRIRELDARERSVYRLLREAQYDLYATFLRLAEHKLGATDLRLASTQKVLRDLREEIDREKPKQ